MTFAPQLDIKRGHPKMRVTKRMIAITMPGVEGGVAKPLGRCSEVESPRAAKRPVHLKRQGRIPCQIKVAATLQSFQSNMSM